MISSHSQLSHPLAGRPFPEACHLPLDLIDPNPDQPRRMLEGVEDLAAHVRQHGLLQPVVVTRAADGRYTLVAGHRRLAALRWLAAHDEYPERWRDVPAVIRTVESDERLTLALAENLSRHALSDAEILTAIRLLVDLHGWSQAEIARRLGVSPQWITLHARVLADSELADYVQTGRLSTAKAYEVQRATGPAARRDALAAALGGAPLRTIRQLAQSIQLTPSDQLAGQPTSSPTATASSATIVPHTAAVLGDTGAPEAAAAPSGAARLKSEAPISTPLWGDQSDSPSTSPASHREQSETDSYTVPFYSDCMQPATEEQPEGQETSVAVRALAIYALLQEARRRRVSSLPARSVRAALLRDLHSVGPQPV